MIRILTALFFLFSICSAARAGLDDFLTLANYAERQGRFQEAIGIYANALQLPDLSDEQKSEIVIRRAWIYMTKVMEHDKALEDLNAAIKWTPSNGSAYTMRGTVYYKRDEFRKSLNDYSKAIDLGANDEHMMGLRGKAYYRLGEMDNAIEDFSAAIRLNPRSSGNFLSRGLAYAAKKNFASAARDFTEAHVLEPKNEKIILFRALAHEALMNFFEAVQDMSLLLAVNPDSADFLAVRARLLFFKGDFKLSESDWSRVVQLKPGDRFALLSRFLAGARDRNAANAISLLNVDTRQIQQEWLQKIYLIYQSRMSAIEIENWIASVDQIDRPKAACLIYYYLGQHALISNNPNAARRYFERALGTSESGLSAFMGSKVELRKFMTGEK